MKLAHVADLHLGRRLGGFSLIEDQRAILSQIADITVKEECSGIIIAGDIYDKTAPSAEAVRLFDRFLTRLSQEKLEVYIISGNHDSPERIDYASELMRDANIHICAEYDGTLHTIRREDEYGPLDICLLPFIKPSYVRGFYPDAQINSYTDMMRTILENSEIDRSKRCLLVCHQFITGASTCDSEYITVGTLDNIDADVFDGFDYVALGHIHGAQNPRKNIRYCGTPLKYSISEINHKKSVTIVDLKEKGDVTVSTVPLVPLRDLAEINGKYDEIMERSFYEKMSLDDFYHITLTDDEDIPGVIHKLRTVYKNIIQLDYDNNRTRKFSMVTSVKQTDKRTPMEMFSSLYEEQNGMPMTEEQREYVSSLIEKIWGEEI